jgi:hypothetical protein
MWVGGDFTLLPENNKKEIKRLVIILFLFFKFEVPINGEHPKVNLAFIIDIFFNYSIFYLNNNNIF